MSFIQNIFTSRDNNTDGNTYVGQLNRLWWNPDTNAFYSSDGSTPGGIPVVLGGGAGQPGGAANTVQYNAGNAVFGGSSFFTVDPANVTVQVGNITLTSSTITGVLANTNFAIGVDEPGSGIVQLFGPVSVYADSNVANVATFQIATNGQTKMLVPTPDNTVGAVEIVGSASGVSVAPGNPGGMLHVTGQNDQVSRIYNDGINNYPLYVGRRYNGLASAPTPVLANQVVSRLGANPYLSTGVFTPLGFAKIDFVATENPTPTAQGSKVQIYTTPDGANTQVITATFQPEGIDLGGNLIPTVDNTYQLGNTTNRWNSVYIGPASLYMEDSTLGTNAELTVDNGALLINGTSLVQIGNMQMTTTGISLTAADSGANLIVGAGTNTGYMQVSMVGIKFRDNTLQTTAAIPLAQRGTANGVATLDSSGKVPTSQLPAGAVVYKGAWSAATNTPTLTNGVGSAGDQYSVSAAGTVNFGAGPITFAEGDFVIYSGTVWEKIPTAIGVTSFNTRTGAVTLTSGDVTNALSAGSIVNSKLANPSWSLSTGQGIGLTGSGTVALGNSITLTNTGVTAAAAGTGVTVSAATGNVTFSIGQNVATNATVQFTAVSTTTTIQATGNITGGNLATGGRLVATGNIETSGYIKTPNTTINNEVVTTGNVTGGNLVTGGRVVSTGNITGGNILTGGLVSSTGNITGGNVLTGGLISATGNITGGNVSATNYTGLVTHSIRNAGNVTGTTLTLNVTTDDLVKCTFNDAFTVAFSSIVAGRVITVIATNTSAGDTDIIIAGISSVNMQGDSTLTVTQQTTAVITYYSLDGDVGNIYASAVYA